MTDFDSTAGLKVTSSKIQFVELSIKSGSVLVKDLQEIFFNEKIDFQKDKETKISALMQGAFDEILLQKDIGEIFISFSLPQHLFYSIQIPYNETLLYSDLIEQFRWELSLLFPFLDSKELLIQYFPVSVNSFSNNPTAFVTALPRNILNVFSEFCKNNNLHLRFIDASHTASDNALSVNKDISGEKLLLSTMVDEKILSLIFYSYGEPFIFSNIPFKNASEIPELVLKEIEKSNFNEPLTNAFISGDELSASFIDRLSARTKINFSLFNPFAKLQLDQQVLDNKHYLIKNNSFSPAVGISIRSL
jgi:Tfp pilus assembly PilM family ATPase